MRQIIERSFVSFLALATAGISGPAFAQGAEEVERAGDEIIVTAQRREERLQDVPISITAFSADRLDKQNITTAQDLSGMVPSLRVGSNGQATRDVQTFNLRGAGATVNGASSVVQYLAEVPLPQGFSTSAQGGPGSFIDLENVQVLAGPQGTLFGRNTTGGAILLVPHRPTDKFEGYVQASLGNYDYRGVEAVVNVPVVEDKLLVRVAGTFQDRRGFTHDIVWDKDRDDMHYFAGRIGITFKPTDRVQNYLMAYGAASDTNGSTYHHVAFNVPRLRSIGFCDSAGRANCSVYEYQSQLSAQLGPRKTRINSDSFDHTDTWGIINKTTIELSEQLTLNNIVSYQRYRKDFQTDEDGTPLQWGELGTGPYPNFPIPGLAEFGIPANGFQNNLEFGPRDNQRQITEELQLQGNLLDNKLTFTVGGFYFDQKPVGRQKHNSLFVCRAELTGTCFPSELIYAVPGKSKALYGQATLDLGVVTPSLDGLKVTAGYRHTWDSLVGKTTYYRRITGSPNFTCITTAAVVSDQNLCAIRAPIKSKAPTWDLGVNYKPVDNLLLFAKVSRGFKAAAFNPFAVRPETRAYQPETLTSYEAGFKASGELGTVPVRLNVTAYKADYNNIQLSVGDFNNGATGSRPVQGKAKIRGFDLDGTIRPFPWLELGGSLGHIDAALIDCVGVCASVAAPRWNTSVYGSLDLPVPESVGQMNLYAGYTHVTETPLNKTEPGGVIEPFGLLNLSLNWRRVAQSNFDLQLFVTNATNKLYRIGNGNLWAATFQNVTMYGEPRMFGARVKYNFGE